MRSLPSEAMPRGAFWWRAHLMVRNAAAHIIVTWAFRHLTTKYASSQVLYLYLFVQNI
jgi:hypothetical protein